MLLNHEKIFDAGFHAAEDEGHKPVEHRYFCPEATLEERRIFHDLAPIPCCPEHILGNMNLRGNVLTVIDMRESLNLSGFEKSKIQNSKFKFEGKVIVAETGGFSAGIAVDNVFDVIYINPSDIKPVPSAVKTNIEQYIKGTAPYNNKVMTILDLRKILEREEWVVNEEA